LDEGFDLVVDFGEELDLLTEEVVEGVEFVVGLIEQFGVEHLSVSDEGLDVVVDAREVAAVDAREVVVDAREFAD
jgi:hypothetical protein